MQIDRQRVAAVQTLEALGYSYRNNEWVSPDAVGAMPLHLTFRGRRYALCAHAAG
jgi:hypothetical protein